MSVLDHPHIIHLAEVYEDEERVCFILELAKVNVHKKVALDIPSLVLHVDI